MNKKGILMVYVFFFTIAAITFSVGLLFWIEAREFSFEIGQPQTQVIRSYMEANIDKYYISNNLEEFSKESINEILKNSGENNPVLKEEYVLLKKGDKECFPDNWENIKTSLSEKIGNKFGDRISFSISRNENSLSIRVESPININYSGDNYKIDYSEDFEKTIEIENFNFDDFIAKIDNIKDISDSCNSNRNCWESSFSSLNGYKLNKVEDKLFKFEFTTLSLDSNIATVKSAVDFETELNLGEEELKC